MWRWSQWLLYCGQIWSVFSTYVEVILNPAFLLLHSTCILHVCGGDPVCQRRQSRRIGYSPRMWRWSYLPHYKTDLNIVFSTYVEVIPLLSMIYPAMCCILHVCGGDPEQEERPMSKIVYSPRMWRWSWCWIWYRWHYRVFSTYVEVILIVFN